MRHWDGHLRYQSPGLRHFPDSLPSKKQATEKGAMVIIILLMWFEEVALGIPMGLSHTIVVDVSTYIIR